MRPSGDDGSITVLVLGLFGVLLTMVAVVVDTSAVILAKRALASAADGAAAAAAQELDEAAVLREGVGSAIPLDRARVRAAVERYQRHADDGQPGLDLTAVTTGSRATVTATRRVRLPFLGPLTGRIVTVRARTTVTSPVQR